LRNEIESFKLIVKSANNNEQMMEKSVQIVKQTDYDNLNDATDYEIKPTAPVEMHKKEETDNNLLSNHTRNVVTMQVAKAVANHMTVAAVTASTMTASSVTKTVLIATICGVGGAIYGLGKLAIVGTRRALSMVRESSDA